MRKQNAAVFVIAMAPVIAAAQQFQTAPAPVDPDTRFEVVAIKPIENANSTMTIMMTPSGLESSVPVGVLLRQALQKPDYQMTGAPAWINTERYSIRAKPPAGTPPAAMTVMIRNLLNDRFQLATHLETREQPLENTQRHGGHREISMKSQCLGALVSFLRSSQPASAFHHGLLGKDLTQDSLTKDCSEIGPTSAIARAGA